MDDSMKKTDRLSDIMEQAKGSFKLAENGAIDHDELLADIILLLGDAYLLGTKHAFGRD